MQNFFSINNVVFQFISKITSSVWLNILWFIFSLPIVTIGASTTALYYASIRLADDRGSSVTADFLHSFKINFKQATKIWLPMLLLGIVLAIDGYVFYHMHSSSRIWTIGLAIFIVACAMYVLVLMYVFPLLSQFNNTSFAMVKNAFFIGIRFLLCTAVILAIHIICALVTIYIFTPFIIFGEGLCAFLSSYFFKNVFALCKTTSSNQD